MLTFQYRALSKDGAKVHGVVEAFDEFEAVAKIRETCSVVTKITQVDMKKKAGKDLFPQRISDKSLAVTCSQLAILLKSGIPIVRAVEMIASQTKDRALKKILSQVAGDVAAGFGLAKSLENKGKGLPYTFIETVRSGEESGNLDKAFARLHQYYDKLDKMKGKVKNAMVYPVFTIATAIVVVIIIMTVAVPVFTRTFQSMGINLPLPTRMLIAISGFFANYILLVLFIFAALVIALKIYGTQEKGRLLYAKLKLKPPVLGKIALVNSASQFANTMSTLLASGLPIIKALEITGRVLDNYYMGSQLLSLVPLLEEGKTLGSSLKRVPKLPGLLVEMTGVGEETGTLEETLEVMGAYYDNEADMASSKALALLEPMIILVLTMVVMFILLSVYAPMFSMYGSIQ